MRTLILVGGGHAHLHCLSQIAADLPSDCRAVLISPSEYQYYSGMFSGFTEDNYDLEDIRIDLKRLCKNIGADFITGQVIAVDAKNRRLTCADGSVYDYDLLSFDIGSTTGIPQEMKPQISSIKPNYLFPEQLKRIRETPNPVVVGGGASGVELAFSIHAWRKQHQLPLNLTLISSSPLLSGLHNRIANSIESIASEKGLLFFTGESVEEISTDAVTTSSGQSFPQSEVLWLTGPKSFSLFQDSGIKTDGSGFLLVNKYLQSVMHPEIFGAGDCIAIEHYPSIPKNGVYAVRQGPVLWENLRNRLDAGELKSFTPQKRYISILSTGGGEAFLTYGRFSMHGKLPWRLKQCIDRKFMKQYKSIYE
ncbi:FAD-dependent oxidoreductase [Planococcus halotolerans]|uniref:Pyridine nucleotide-disulfide oxidoreductase n=1 Tax=Planococcus halotolerans TaxID=2233542 RepID=A0A365KUB0_9BACL|nr:FAD-dependent oxidoreductase [Planococcus halotolerans]RAZ76754.1 pyridine nucleotide-disulfide oxidoreductase [Planococcus halotolerans]